MSRQATLALLVTSAVVAHTLHVETPGEIRRRNAPKRRPDALALRTAVEDAAASVAPRQAPTTATTTAAAAEPAREVEPAAEAPVVAHPRGTVDRSWFGSSSRRARARASHDLSAGPVFISDAGERRGMPTTEPRAPSGPVRRPSQRLGPNLATDAMRRGRQIGISRTEFHKTARNARRGAAAVGVSAKKGTPRRSLKQPAPGRGVGDDEVSPSRKNETHPHNQHETTPPAGRRRDARGCAEFVEPRLVERRRRARAEVTKRHGAFKMLGTVSGANRGDAAGRDVDIPRATERAERTIERTSSLDGVCAQSRNGRRGAGVFLNMLSKRRRKLGPLRRRGRG